jgi:ATP-dependent Zn protease
MARPNKISQRADRFQERAALAREWRRLSRAATFVAVLMSPAVFLVLYGSEKWPLRYSLLVTIFGVIAFRGLVDVVVHKFIPRPGLQGADASDLGHDAMQRRRLWFWRRRWRLVFTLVVILGTVALVIAFFGGNPFHDVSKIHITAGTLVPLVTQVLLLFVVYGALNLFILMGPLIYMAVRQAKGYEPGDADWGVKLDDVRGQAEPKQEVERVITLWQSGDDFRKAGGKPERGLLFIGAPGTGKTMLSKAIATSFNSPIVTMPGSGFAGTFIGMDALAVQFVIVKARRLARKWGGQCIIFIDEIDAVGMRRSALGTGAGTMSPNAMASSGSFHDFEFHGSNGALTSTGDLVLETRAWREKMFAMRAPASTPVYPPWLSRIGASASNFIFPGGMGGQGGGLALNQLLVQMDGVDAPRGMRKFITNRVNNLLDASYVVPHRVGKVALRLPPPKPSSEQIYFIGATNVPIDNLDPALIRPGRMGRHIWFRTPTWEDRKDIFDLYLNKVDHDPELDSERRRDELARITHGYSPAMIEQVCSMALTLAHSDARQYFEWQDIVEAMTTIESGTAQGIDYVPEETRAVAIHEAGHAVASHVYMQDVLSTRLSIRKRGGSLGHHQAIEKEERFSSWRHEEVGKLVWTLGAMAAEHVFYGENSTGVGGDVQSATTRAAWMVGMCGMGPEPINLNGRRFASEEERAEEETRVMKRFEKIGGQIMNRARASNEQGDAIAAILGDPHKRSAAAQILGQAYITAVCLIRHNREETLRIAETLVNRRELHGDEVVDLLDAAHLQAPVIDVNDETIWPKL